MKEIEGPERAHENGDTPRLQPARTSRGHSTVWKGVQSGLVLHVPVDAYALGGGRGRVDMRASDSKVGMRGDGRVRTFDDVNFTAGGPWTYWARRPEGGPGGATGRHVCHVKDQYCLSICSTRMDAHAVAPTRGCINDGPIVGTHDEFMSNRCNDPQWTNSNGEWRT
jgi:hypothetical protein